MSRPDSKTLRAPPPHTEASRSPLRPRTTTPSVFSCTAPGGPVTKGRTGRETLQSVPDRRARRRQNVTGLPTHVIPFLFFSRRDGGKFAGGGGNIVQNNHKNRSGGAGGHTLNTAEANTKTRIICSQWKTLVGCPKHHHRTAAAHSKDSGGSELWGGQQTERTMKVSGCQNKTTHTHQKSPSPLKKEQPRHPLPPVPQATAPKQTDNRRRKRINSSTRRPADREEAQTANSKQARRRRRRRRRRTTGSCAR